MNDVTSKGYIYKIYFNRGSYSVSFYQIENNKEIFIHYQDNCGINPNDYPNLFGALSDENIFLCYRYQEFYQKYRAYLEKQDYIMGQIKKQELCSCRGDTLHDALLTLEQEVLKLELGRGKKL